MTIAKSIKARLFGERKGFTILSDMMRAPGSIGRDYHSQAKEGYEANVYCRRCVQTISMAVAGIEWDLYRMKGKDLQEIEGHPMQALLRKPNPQMGGSRLMETVAAYLMLRGESYLYAAGPDGNRPPLELWPLRPDRVRPVPDASGREIARYEYTLNGIVSDLPREKVLQLKLFNPLDDLHGMSPITSAALSIRMGNEAKRWNTALLENGARPMGALSTTAFLTQAQVDSMRSQFSGLYVGPENAGRPVVLEGGVQWQEMGLSPADMSWLESQKLSAREIAICYGVPPEMIGDSSNKTYANYREARRAFYQETILPTMDWVRDELNSWLLPMYPDKGLYLDYDRDDIDALQEDRAELWGRLTNATWLTINEKREATGYEAVEGGDVLLIPATMLPAEAQPPSTEGKRR